MNTRLHLLGGAGRIGNSLLQSLIAEPLKSIDSIFVYCDSKKL